MERHDAADVLRGRDAMLTSLSLAAGCVDAVGYLGLGQVFVANMTGNTVLLGLAILAGELRPVARFLDRAEVRLRRFARFVRELWRASVVGKISVVLVSAICVAALLYVAYLLLFGG